MKQLPRISQAEWQVMKVFWTKSVTTANEVIDALSDDADWKPATIKSLINRLVKKGALGFKQEGKVYVYFPQISEDECLQAESKSFLQRLYGGALKPLLVNFLKHEDLTQEDIEELKQILNERKS